MRSNLRPVLVWFRNDLRLSDNPALQWAVRTGKPIIAAFILEDGDSIRRPIGGAAKWWLHHSLSSLAAALHSDGIELHVKKGSAEAHLNEIISRSAADSVVWNRRYDAADIKTDAQIKAELIASGIEAKSFNGTLLVEPWDMQTKSGTPFRVFTPFWKALAAKFAPDEVEARPLPHGDPAGSVHLPGLEQLDLVSKLGWDNGFHNAWSPGEYGARKALDDFLRTGIERYCDGRDFPARTVTSQLSAHLRFGEISPVQIWRSVKMRHEKGDLPSPSANKFLSEIAWREFAYHLLYYNPDLATKNYNPLFDNYPWQFDQSLFDAWKRGKTGYPIVDAGMRQLWQTGWMHNRVRMVAASFLIKHLLIDWRHGEAWFWDTLVDADPANNPAGWQWVAGSGADASPYFRIFNPVLQGEKFDPDGNYVRQWVPELADVDARWIHKPWQAPVEVLAREVRLGKTYPNPIVDHGLARETALAGYKAIRAVNKSEANSFPSSATMLNKSPAHDNNWPGRL